LIAMRAGSRLAAVSAVKEFFMPHRLFFFFASNKRTRLRRSRFFSRGDLRPSTVFGAPNSISVCPGLEPGPFQAQSL
jgi:hypothetical protein